MKGGRLACLLAACLALTGPAAGAEEKFAFGYVAHPFGDALADETGLREALAETDRENLAFVVVGGIKSAIEPCDDELYAQRRTLLNQARHGLVVSVAESDWSDCRYRDGRPAALERLHRLRELFFADDLSFGATRIPLIRQSANPKFRDYVENARWEIGNIMFATLNLPANNNRFLNAAGRNSEFEDRLVANRDWLQRVVMYAKRKQYPGIVIFCDGNPLFPQEEDNVRRDGFRETRRQLASLAAGYPGKILLVHNQQSRAGKQRAPAIRWKGNLGDLAVASDWLSVQVTPAQPVLFSVAAGKSANPARD
ncbi:hypothetical protein [Noviherbaspirillum sedimenti]|uniref:Transmembrane protein n=1 Tax=Noviherbaspirillum sedimenti TaxID=2320865 RepID=A0A3A3G014_9BURK|nr:hypothetical protein [Noviherbaspirillum sedimenti]RJG00239.1 hypothetical protein D3878_00510 [Noviherbaspirillum sedimenti]